MLNGKKGKKIIALIVIFVLAFSVFTACSSNGSGTKSSKTETSSSQKSGKDSASKKTDNKKSAKAKKESSQNKATKKSSSASSKTTKKSTNSSSKYCTVSVSCTNAVKNIKKMKNGSAKIIPKSGIILKKTKVTLKSSDTVLAATRRVLKSKNIALSCKNETSVGSAYIEGIGGLFEFDGGDESGWMFSINGKFPSKGCNKIIVENKANIVWAYTLNLGKDVK